MDYERQKRLIYETIFRSNLYKNYTNATPENYFDIGSRFIYWLYSFILKDLLKKNIFCIRNTDNIDKFFKYYNKFKNSTDNVAEKYTNTMMHRRSRRRSL